MAFSIVFYDPEVFWNQYIIYQLYVKRKIVFIGRQINVKIEYETLGLAISYS